MTWEELAEAFAKHSPESTPETINAAIEALKKTKLSPEFVHSELIARAEQTGGEVNDERS